MDLDPIAVKYIAKRGFVAARLKFGKQQFVANIFDSVSVLQKSKPDVFVKKRDSTI